MTIPVITQQQDGVAEIVLNRPDSLNAINVELLDALIGALRDVRSAPAILIRGEGRAFCTGEDLRETLAPLTGEPDELRASLERLQEVTRLMTSAPAAVIAAVHGFAVGGGAELALSADLIVAHPETEFRFPEVTIGHAPTNGISARLPAAIGLVRAKEIMLTGRAVHGDEALALGMVNELSVDPVGRARDLAQEMASRPARSVAAAKRGLEQAAVSNQELVLSAEVDAALYCFASPQAQAAFADFSGRTSPRDPTSRA